MTPSAASRRADLTQLFVYMPQLRGHLRGEPVPSAAALRFATFLREGDAELARTITDTEVAAARRSAAVRFADVFPMGI